MATRENQTLQISLMVFAILLVVFVVLTYWFWKSWDDQRTKNNQLEEEKSNLSESFRTVQIESNQYMRMIGFHEQDEGRRRHETKGDADRQRNQDLSLQAPFGQQG